MRVLLDEQLPRQLADLLAVEHDATTVQRQGWAGLRDRDVLRLAGQHEFQVFITADRNLQYQQNTSEIPFGILVLVARSNTLRDLEPLVGAMLNAIPVIAPGQVVQVRA